MVLCSCYAVFLLAKYASLYVNTNHHHCLGSIQRPRCDLLGLWKNERLVAAQGFGCGVVGFPYFVSNETGVWMIGGVLAGLVFFTKN